MQADALTKVCKGVLTWGRDTGGECGWIYFWQMVTGKINLVSNVYLCNRAGRRRQSTTLKQPLWQFQSRWLGLCL